MAENRHGANDLKQMQSLPLEAKIHMTKERIRLWYESWTRYEIENLDTGKIRYITATEEPTENNGGLKPNECITTYGYQTGAVYVSFSGGKDSTVLKHIVDSMYDDVPSVFVNTGLEYPEIQRFVKDIKAGKWDCFNSNVEIIRPKMRFDEVIQKYGYPVISKEVSKQLYEISQCAKKHGIPARETAPYKRKFNPDSEYCKKYPMFTLQKWDWMVDAPFNVSHMCCKAMKKTPAYSYEKRTSRKPVVGTMAEESRLRKTQWMKTGCNGFDGKMPRSAPLSFWTEQDILHYIKKFDVPYCPVYGDIQVKQTVDNDRVFEGQINMIDYLGCYEPEDLLETSGLNRTGCMFCMFGCHLEKEPNRFQRMKVTHPKQYEYCMEKLGLKEVLEYIGVKYE